MAIAFHTTRIPRRVYQYVATHGRALSTSVLSQALSSLTNLALGLFFLRVQTPSEYGAYGLGLSACYLYSGVGNALLLTQLVVNIAERPEALRPSYAGRMFAALSCFCAGTIAVAGLVGMAAASVLSPHFTVATALAAVSFVLKDFFVRHAYAVRAETKALWINVTVAAALATVLGISGLARTSLSATSALHVFALSHLCGACLGLLTAAIPLRTIRLSDVRDDVSEAWKGGRWALGGVVVTWIQSQAYAYVTLVAAGAGAVGRANAARLLVAPLLFLIPAVNQVAVPRLATLRVENPRKMLEFGATNAVALLFIALAYSVLLLGSIDSLVPALLGAQYGALKGLIVAWCITVAALIARDCAATLLVAKRGFRALTVMTTASAIFSLACVTALARHWHDVGAVLGTAAGEMLLAVLLWRALLR